MSLPPSPVLVAGYDDMRYPWPGEDGKTVPRVSSIIGAVGNKTFENLAAKQVAIKAVTDDTWRSMEPENAIQWLQESRWDKANFGNAVHRIIAEWLDHPTLEITNVSTDHINYLTGAIAFLNEHASRVIHVETTVYNRTYEYAGTVDLIAKMKTGELAVIDWKTGGIYPTYALQLVAYMNAERIATVDGRLSQLPRLSVGYAVQLPGDGTYKAHRVNPTPRAFRTFIALRSLQKWKDDHEGEAFDAVIEPLEDVATTN